MPSSEGKNRGNSFVGPKCWEENKGNGGIQRSPFTEKQTHRMGLISYEYFRVLHLLVNAPRFDGGVMLCARHSLLRYGSRLRLYSLSLSL